jgi:outer membrane protein assembly factor BamB
VYVVTKDSVLHAVRADGSRVWDNSDRAWQSTPAVASDSAIYVAANRVLAALNPDGSTRWELPLEANLRVAPAISSDGSLYLVTEDNALQAFGPDGSKRWTLKDRIHASAPLIGPDGNIYVATGWFQFAVRASDRSHWRRAALRQLGWKRG